MLQNLSKEALSGIQEVFFICFLGKFDNSCIERNWENPERHISNFKDTKRHHLIEISVFSRVRFFGQRGNWKICILVSSQECNLLSVPATDCRLHISNCKHAKLLHSNLERVGIFLPFTTRLHKHTHTHFHTLTELCLLFQYLCRANSVTWNPHKMMGVPLQCSAILVRERVSMCLFHFPAPHRTTSAHTNESVHFHQNHLVHVSSRSLPLQGLLQGCNSMCAGYLFQPDKQYDVTYDTGDKAIQCGRHVDIFKFWLMWKAKVCFNLQCFCQLCCHMQKQMVTASFFPPYREQ